MPEIEPHWSDALFPNKACQHLTNAGLSEGNSNQLFVKNIINMPPRAS